MTIDWGTLLTSLISTIILGGGTIFTFFLFLKQRKKKEDSEVINSDASAAANMLDFTDKLQDFSTKMVINYQEALDKKEEVILEHQKKLIELEAKVEEHSKKIKNLTLNLVGEHRRKIYAEKFICLNENCGIRQPKIGTFKTEETNESNAK